MATQVKAENWGKMSRKEQREWTRRIWSSNPGLDVLHPDAAGVDIGSREHYAAVPPGRDERPVRRYACFTESLWEMASWLKACGITSVALQSTGVYWIPVYDVLEAAGLEVYLVNAGHTKNLPGRKSDVQESQWLMKLHTYGLLSNSFRPVSEIRMLRSYWRQRAEHVQAASTCIQRLQKTLTEMNVQLHHVISDLSGVTGMRILRAIVKGERDPHKLAALRHSYIKASEEEIVRSLEGTWRPELMFVLSQELDTYDVYQRKIGECDAAVERHLASMASRPQPRTEPGAGGEEPHTPPKKRRKAPAGGNAPAFDLRGELVRLTGVDVTKIDGVNVMTVQTVLSETGLDMSRWKTEAHFSSWLGLSPSHDISGGKVLKKGTRKVVNPAATALRIAASTLLKSQSYLGEQYRRFRARLGAPKAITAMAHKLARLIYRMLKFGQDYVDKGAAHYQALYRKNQIRFLTKRAKQLGLQLVDLPTMGGS